MAVALERGGRQDSASAAQTWREPPILMAVIGTPWTCLITVFFQGYCFMGSGSCLESCSQFLWRSWKGLSAFVSHGSWWDSVHSWTGASLQAERLLASPAAAPMCCHVLIGTAESLALHLRHVLISLWISNYGKKRLLKVALKMCSKSCLFPITNAVRGHSGRPSNI